LQKIKFPLHILLLDNYDSFTWNLFHYLEEFGAEVAVFRNDEITIQQAEVFDAIVLSPGPGLPKDAGIMPELIRHFYSRKPILGICLGMQAIAECFGATLIQMNTVKHGVATPLEIQDKTHAFFSGLQEPVYVGRYHSWVIHTPSLPQSIQVTSVDDNNYPMSLQHQAFSVSGMQYHPESILTPQGKKMLENWYKSLL
jgi:anthranilate synthase component 2